MLMISSSTSETTGSSVWQFALKNTRLDHFLLHQVLASTKPVIVSTFLHNKNYFYSIIIFHCRNQLNRLMRAIGGKNNNFLGCQIYGRSGMTWATIIHRINISFQDSIATTLFRINISV